MMDKTTRDNLIKFTQGIVASTPRNELEDEWVTFSEDIDVNIWWEEDGPIRATAYPIKRDSHGFKYTDISNKFFSVPIV
mgnify:CR=1 FL=1